LPSVSLSPALGTNVATVGALAWTDPNNIAVGGYATALATGTQITNYLRGSQYGAAIPWNATIVGIEIEIDRRGAGGSVGAWDVIDSETLAAPASSISFTGIDTTYKMFRVTLYSIKDGTAGALQLRLNNDSGANYVYQDLTGDATTVNGARATAQAQFVLTTGETMDAATAGTFEIVIGKTVAGSAAMLLSKGTYYHTTTPALNYEATAGRWNNTADLISRIDLIASAGNFAAGTVCVLEGV